MVPAPYRSFTNNITILPPLSAGENDWGCSLRPLRWVPDVGLLITGPLKEGPPTMPQLFRLFVSVCSFPARGHSQVEG